MAKIDASGVNLAAFCAFAICSPTAEFPDEVVVENDAIVELRSPAPFACLLMTGAVGIVLCWPKQRGVGEERRAKLPFVLLDIPPLETRR